ncbi:MAG: BrnT family toxin [Alphaproteobacteria bacterium]|nr:BrnT family toxin [Alphaproteobacteria bacterium]
MNLSWDEAKRQATLEQRGLDFATVSELFAGLHFTAEDLRRDYGERRFISAGAIAGRLCVTVWTPRGSARHIISLRKANDREKKRFAQALI